MDEAVKAKWVSALKSGQYVQTKGKLTDGHGFCCLGVLCNLYGLEKGVMWVRGVGGRLRLDGTEDSTSNAEALPDVVQEWAGLDDLNPGFAGGSVPVRNGRAYSLAECNDEGMNFAKVADVIATRL